MSKTGQGAAGVPPPKFWEDDLELPREHILRQIERDGYLDTWINKRTGRQLAILQQALGIDGEASTRKLKTRIRESNGDLLDFVLVDQFSQFKSKVAVVDFAGRVLPADVVESCQISDTEYDKTALLFAIYRRRWADLRLIFHLDKTHKTGFARMKLKGKLRRPRQTFRDFLNSGQVADVLARFDKTRKDGRGSELKAVIPLGESDLVFIRRPNRPNHLVGLRGGVIHAYDPEWIILDFRDEGTYVNIAAVSVSLPLDIANGIASAYYGRDREYENASEITYRKQIERFLGEVRGARQGDLILVEATVSNSPLNDSPKLRISHPDSRSIGNSISHFERCIGKLLSRVEQIDSIKVLFCQKRVSLKFEAAPGSLDEFVVRYSDQRLNALQRIEFEKLMRDVHGITVLSTEKQFKQPA